MHSGGRHWNHKKAQAVGGGLSLAVEKLRGSDGGVEEETWEGNLTKATPPKEGLWTPPPPRPDHAVVALLFLYSNPRSSSPETLFEGSGRSLVGFPPLTLDRPAYHGPKSL